MSRELNYKDCINFLENKLNINLFDYQKEILKALCEGKEVRIARCCGRTYVTKAFGKYVGSVYSENDYTKTPDVVIDYTHALNNGLITEKHIENAKKTLSQKDFNKEYLCIDNKED